MDKILIRGARTHNLANIDLDLPRDKFIVITGISGSGKSSIVFDTIATESQRLLNENFSMFVRNFLPKLSTTIRKSHGTGVRKQEAAG